jgi:hypothetical protein
MLHGKRIRLDAQDVARVNAHVWSLETTAKGKHYFAATIDGRRVKLHRFIINIPRGVLGDHKSCDELDNRRSNLRPASAEQNSHNRSKRKNCLGSAFKGVQFTHSMRHAPWRARITVKGALRHLGYFTTEVEAARAYDTAAEEHFGEFCKLNFVSKGA